MEPRLYSLCNQHYDRKSRSGRINNVIEGSRLRLPMRNTLFASTDKHRRVRRGLRPKDVSQRKATQRQAELSAEAPPVSALLPAD